MQEVICTFDINHKIELAGAIDEDNEILSQLKSDPLLVDSISPKSLLLKFLEKLETRMTFARVSDLALAILAHPNPSKYDYEINKSIQSLLSRQKYEETFLVFDKMAETGFPVDQHILMDAMVSLHSSKMTNHLIEKCLDLILRLVKRGYDFNQTFWKTAYDIMKSQNIKYSNEMLLNYPFKVNYKNINLVNI